jgi:hypothetical protein
VTDPNVIVRILELRLGSKPLSCLRCLNRNREKYGMGEQETGARPATDPPPPGRKRRWVRVAGLGLLALLLVAGAVLT